MGVTLTCENCGETHRYDKSEIRDFGTAWHPIWALECTGCGSPVSFDSGPTGLFDHAEISRTSDGVKIKVRVGVTDSERVEEGDIREYWAQKYFKDNYKKLGFSDVKGPYRHGPDFQGVYEGKRVVIEIERSYGLYTKHGHHEDPRFHGPCVLVVLSPHKPSKKLKEKLPETVIQIDTEDFVEWWKPKARREEPCRRLDGLIALIGREFQERYTRFCSEKGRDMSVCPECHLCPYFGEGLAFEAQRLFEKMACDFIVRYEYPVTSEDFKLSGIKPSEIDNFFFKHSNKYLFPEGS